VERNPDADRDEAAVEVAVVEMAVVKVPAARGHRDETRASRRGEARAHRRGACTAAREVRAAARAAAAGLARQGIVRHCRASQRRGHAEKSPSQAHASHASYSAPNFSPGGTPVTSRAFRLAL